MDLSPRQERLGALLGFDAGAIDALLTGHPLLAAALLPGGPFARMGHGAYRKPTLDDAERTVDEVARLISTRAGMALTIATLDQSAYQLAIEARWRGGTIERSQAVAELAATPEQLEEAAAQLARLLVTDPARGWVVLRPGFDEVLPLPGVSMLDRVKALSSDRLATGLRSLRVDPPRTKPERLDALRAALMDKATLEAAIDGLDPPARQMLDVLVARAAEPPGTVPVADLGVPYYSSYRSFRTPATDALRQLADGMLVCIDEYEQTAALWLEVLVGVQGALHPSWPQQPQPVTVPIDRLAGGPTRPLLALEALLEAWAAAAPAVLKTGGIPVRAVRAVAKPLGVSEAAAVTVVQLALELDLLARHTVGVSGRGRNRVEDQVWRPGPHRAVWSSLATADRWTALVQTWLDGPETGSYGQVDLAECAARHLVIDALVAQPEGTGLALADALELLTVRHHIALSATTAARVIDELRVLGLVPPEGPVGLTDAARRLLAGDAPSGAGPAAGWVVQPDHTVMVEPGAEVDALARLGRVAVLESDAGVRIYRLDPARLAAAMAGGEDADGLLAFLAAGSRVPLPEVVEHLVRDAARRPAAATIGTAGSYLSCDDSSMLTKAVAIKAAKLTRIAPSVAVSPLSEAKLAAALASKGIVLTASASASPRAAITGVAGRSAPPGRSDAPATAEVTMPPTWSTRPHLVATAAARIALRDALLSSTQPEVRARREARRKADQDVRLARIRAEMEARRNLVELRADFEGAAAAWMEQTDRLFDGDNAGGR